MADRYINLDADYFKHIKTERLVKKLGRGSDVLPIRLWCYTAQHYAKDGRLVGHTRQDIEDAVAWWGKKGECIAAMLNPRIKFLEKSADGTFIVHDWLIHSGHLSAFSSRASKAAKARWDKSRSNGQSMLEHDPSNAQADATQCPNPPTQPSDGTNPTHQPRDGLGVGGVQGGEGGGNLVREMKSEGEQLEKQSLLARLNIHDTAAVQRLVGRRDVTCEKILREIQDIKRDPKVGDVGAVLLKRFGEASNGRHKR